MYYRSRSSIRKPNFNRRYQGSFNGNRSNQRGGGQRRSQLEGADVNMFIRKAVEAAPEEVQIGIQGFDSFNLHEALKQNIAFHGYTKPSPIQSQAIGPILEGRDVIGLAGTGTGKTAAFLIPLIQKIYLNRNLKALVIVPTRELALQINEEFRNFLTVYFKFRGFIPCNYQWNNYQYSY